MASTGITFGGLSSGLDTTSIISSIISADSTSLTRMATEQGNLLQKQQIYNQFSSQVQTFATTASALNVPGAFNTIQANSSDSTVATITAGANSAPGVYTLSVSKLAQAHKIASAAQNDTTTALGLTGGTMTINGNAISVDATDSLTSIAKKINGLSTGVVASLINGGNGNAYLTLTANKSGVANQVQVGDLTGNAASALGLISGSATVRSAITNGAQSDSFASNTNTFSNMMATNGITSKSFSIDGTAISVDMTTDSLQSVADKINGASISGVSATVATGSDSNGNTTYSLQISGASGTPTFTDTDNFLQGIGVLQSGFGNQLVQAQDAHYTLDNVSLTSSSNTITDAVPGVTLNLLAADATTPKTATLNLTQDMSAIKSKVQGFADSYNALASFIDSNSSFDSSTFATGPLFGDSTAQAIQSSITNMLFTNVSGLKGQYTNLASLGFSLGQDGKMSVDSSTLQTAISNNPTAVAAIFQATGSSDNSALSYVSSTAATKSTNQTSYPVNITQVATKGSYTAGKSQTSPSTVTEQLTFNGGLFGNTPYKLSLDIGSTAATTIAKINNDSTLKNLIFASLDNSGKLTFASKRYGTGGNFTVASNFSSSTSNSGIGPGGEGTTVLGVDVAGTINGEDATGSGQFLTGKTGNTNTEGLQIQYTGTATGAVGSMSVSKGIGMQTFSVLDSFLNATNGLFTTENTSLQGQISQYDKDMAAEQARLDQEKTDLRLKFANMESAIASAKQQAQSLSGFSSTSSTG